MEPRAVNRYRDLRSQHRQPFQIFFAETVRLIAFQSESANHMAIAGDRHGQFAVRLGAQCQVVRFVSYLGCDYTLARGNDPADNSGVSLQNNIGDLIRLGITSTSNALDCLVLRVAEKNSGRVKIDNIAHRLNYEIK